MKRMLITALVAGLPAAAHSADLWTGSAQVSAPYQEASDDFNWTGFYLGVNGGYGWVDSAMTFPGNIITEPDGDGWMAGGTVGANWQPKVLLWFSASKGISTGLISVAPLRVQIPWLAVGSKQTDGWPLSVDA